MGLGKKAKREAKAVKGKTKKDAGKVKHKGKKAKNAAEALTGLPSDYRSCSGWPGAFPVATSGLS